MCAFRGKKKEDRGAKERRPFGEEGKEPRVKRNKKGEGNQAVEKGGELSCWEGFFFLLIKKSRSKGEGESSFFLFRRKKERGRVRLAAIREL